MTSDQLRRYAAIAGVVAIPLLLPLLMRDDVPVPLTLSECGSIEAVDARDPAEFSIAGLLGKDGSPIHGGRRFDQLAGGRVCGLDDGPLSFHGRTRLPDTADVWLVSTSDTGQFYLTPRIRIKAGEWVVGDIRIGSNIVKLSFLQVDAETDKLFRERVAARNWQGLWPDGARELASLTFGG